MKFELGLSKNLLRAIQKSGYEEATPFKNRPFPGLSGPRRDWASPDRTGKTAAFGLPLLEHVDLDNPAIQAIIISPTGVAIQTQEELFRLGRDKHVKVQVVYGGADIRRQIKALKQHPNFGGTPGRLWITSTGKRSN